jgi:hypothetical protein
MDGPLGSTPNANDIALVAEFRTRYLELERRCQDLVNAPEGDPYLLSGIGLDLDLYSEALHVVRLGEASV